MTTSEQLLNTDRLLFIWTRDAAVELAAELGYVPPSEPALLAWMNTHAAEIQSRVMAKKDAFWDKWLALIRQPEVQTAFAIAIWHQVWEEICQK